MHILHILEATAGGTRRHVLDLLPTLSRRGAQCSLIYSPLRNPGFEKDAAFLQSQNITTYCVPMTRGWDSAIDIPALRSIRSIIRKSTFDVIHAHSSKAGFLGRLATLPCPKSTFIYTPHCIAINTGLPRRQKQIARIAETLLAPWTDHFIAVSLPEKQAILRAHLAPSRKVHLVYNGVEASRFATTFNADFKAPFTIGCFGRLSPQKNQEFALKVLFELRKQQKEIKVLFAGDGEIKSSLQQLSQNLHLQDAVIWQEETRDTSKLYTQCDAVIQPSRWEGCPYTVLEAMASARPVLASPAGAMPHLLAGCGEIHQLSQLDKWVKTLLSWKNNPELREALGNEARERARKYFSLENMVNGIMEVYRASAAR
jgi:glycosyltransferase involved in cell wall biosynthesis